MLREKIDKWAAQCPTRIAHRNRAQALTYEQLKVHSDALAVWLRERAQTAGISRGTPVVVYGHKENEMLICFLGCIKAGYPYVPVDSSVPTERFSQIVHASRAGIVLSPQVVPAAIRESKVDVEEEISLTRNNLPYSEYFGQIPALDWQVQQEETYYIIYTSGSTGVPKGVQIPLRALESFLNWVNDEYKPVEMAEVFLNQAPFSFDLSVMDLYMSLSTGGTLWSVDKELITNLGELFVGFANSQITFWISTPSFAEMCLADHSFNGKLLPKLKRFLFCGEVLTHDCAAKLVERFPNALVENLYGPTEATVAVTTMTITPEILAAYNPLPVGRVKADCRILVCGSEQLSQFIDGGCRGIPEVLPDGERGELIIAGPSVSTGYLNAPELTSKAFFAWMENGESWHAYRTGDAASVSEGLLFFYGRMDFQVKLHGYRIELGDIEENLRKVDWIKNSVVLPIERMGRVEYLQAFLVAEQPVTNQFEAAKSLREALRNLLPEYMIPRRLTFLPQLPMTPNGKVDRRALLGGKQ